MNKHKNSNSIGAQLQSKGVNLSTQNHNNDSTRKSPRRNSNQHIVDGFDHINVEVSGETDLGRFMAFDAEYQFTIPKYGSFSSIRALWTYLSTMGHPENLRHMNVARLREFAHHRDENGMKFEHPELQYICAYVLADKLNQPKVRQAILEAGDISYRSYYKVGDNYRSHSQSWWWIDVCVTLTTDIREGVQPDARQFANLASNFIDACVPLKTATRVGMFTDVKEPAPAEPKAEPTERKARKRQKYVPRAFGEAPKHRDMVASELDVNELNTRILGVTDRSQFGEVMSFLMELPVEELKNFIQSSNHVVTIPVSLTEQEIGPDDVKHKFIMTFNPETFEFVGLSTGVFNNPLILDDSKEDLEVEEDATDEVIKEMIRTTAGISEGVSFDVHVVSKAVQKTPVEA